jgi:hypothetical protein
LGDLPSQSAFLNYLRPKGGAQMGDDVLAYVADVAQQLADLCREASPRVSICLELAAMLARGDDRAD